MTKQVRIENADTSDHKLVVQVWNQGGAVDEVVQPDTLENEMPLDNPTDMIEEYVHSTRYLVIKEVG